MTTVGLDSAHQHPGNSYSNYTHCNFIHTLTSKEYTVCRLHSSYFKLWLVMQIDTLYPVVCTEYPCTIAVTVNRYYRLQNTPLPPSNFNPLIHIHNLADNFLYFSLITCLGIGISDSLWVFFSYETLSLQSYNGKAKYMINIFIFLRWSIWVNAFYTLILSALLTGVL